jgi:hypothetical protein
VTCFSLQCVQCVQLVQLVQVVQMVPLGWCVCSHSLTQQRSEEAKCAKLSGMCFLTRREKKPLKFSLTEVHQEISSHQSQTIKSCKNAKAYMCIHWSSIVFISLCIQRQIFQDPRENLRSSRHSTHRISMTCN